MKKAILRVIFDALILLTTIFFLFFLWYFFNGSLEMAPTEEDQDKIAVVSVFGMLLSAVLGTLSAAIRLLLLRKK